MTLQQDVKTEIDAVNQQLKQNDIHIFNYFQTLEKQQDDNCQLASLYTQFFEYDKPFAAAAQLYTQLHQNLQFVSHNLPVEQINANFLQIEPAELEFKELIRTLMSLAVIQADMKDEARKNFELYGSKKLVYFAGDVYYEDNLKVLFTAINDYAYLAAKAHFLLKKQLLDYQEQLQQRITAVVPA